MDATNGEAHLTPEEIPGFSDEQVEYLAKHGIEDSKVIHAPENKIPWWARMDIDRWQRHLMNGTEKEAEGSWSDFQLVAEKPGLLVVEAYEVDVLLLISSKEGVTFIKCYGETGCVTYVGVQKDHHEVYTTM